MLHALTTLLGLQLLGETLVQALHLPMPGPVVGMLALFIILLWRGGPPPWLETTAQGLLSHLGLFFVPAGVGIITHTELLARTWPAIMLALLVGTALTLAATAIPVHLHLALAARRTRSIEEGRHD